MPVAFTATTPEDLPALALLMRQAFAADANASFLRPEVLHWKYLTPLETGNSPAPPRAWLIAQDETPLAHGCLWPVTVRVDGQPVHGACLIDWFSAKSASGMGVMLVRKVLPKAAFLLSIGGSEATRAIMPKIGFTTVGQLPVYARPLRSFAQLRSRADGFTPKNISRAIRNCGWQLRSLAPHHSWTARQAVPSPALLTACHADGSSLCSPELLAYLLACPIGEHSCWILESRNEAIGWFLLSRLRGQTRLLDLRIIPANDPAAYAAAYAIAVQTARLDAAAHELTVQASLAPQPAQALEANGFVLRENRPLFLCDPQGLLRSVAPHLLLSRLDDDSAAFDFPDYPYLT
jgi:hypothetical protein